jgi:hypothetical protein
MLMGIGIIGVLASILSSFLAGNSRERDDNDPNPDGTSLQAEMSEIKNELATLRQLLLAKGEGTAKEEGE